jgi:hypothetical protein
MFDLRKLFVREARAQRGGKSDPDPDSDYHPSDRKGEGLEVEYQGLIATQFRRWGVAPGCVTVEVRQIGRAPDGFDVFVGMVRLAKWDRTTVLRMLLGLPMLESRVRKVVRGTWLADFSHFGGLWLHASEQLHVGGQTGELRDLLMTLVPPSAPGPDAGAAQNHSGYGVSSVPPTQQPQPTVAPQSANASEPGDAPVSG